MDRHKDNKVDVEIRETDQLTNKELQKALIAHFREDTKRFDKQEEDHRGFEITLGKIEGFMENLTWLSDITRGTQLLKRPSLWVVGFVITLVALTGGLKALLTGILAWVMPK